MKWAIEQPRDHSSVHQEVSTYSAGADARGPKRAASASSTALRRSPAPCACQRCETGPNVNAAITPGAPDAGPASIVTSAAEPGSAVWPLSPSARQNGSS